MSQNAAGESATRPTDEPWMPGNPFKCPLHKDGNHWETLLGPLLEKDKAQCASWKEEMQNLVILAGLFSSVISAFLVQTYQALQPEPSDQMIFLLSQIVSNTNTHSSNTTALLTPPEFFPDSNAIRINVLWFISLVLSLTTVLIAIVTSQWLTEHQQYPASMTIVDKLALYNMRQESLIKWHVPEIVSSVPLLLLLGLVLFLVGLIDFAAGFVKIVAIPVIIVICIPLAFITLTTSLPALQLILINFSTLQSKASVPNQCPYRSTQSQALQRISTYSSAVFLLLHLPLTMFWSLPKYIFQMIKFGPNSTRSHTIPFFVLMSNEHVYKKVYSTLCLFWKADSWVSFDEKWMLCRTTQMMSITTESGTHWAYYTDTNCGFVFDCADAVQKIQGQLRDERYRDLSAEIINLYHVVDDVQEYFNKSYYSNSVMMLQKLLYSITGDLNTNFVSLADSYRMQPGLYRDETLFIFLSSFEWLPGENFPEHLEELNIRLLNYCFSRFHNVPPSPNTSVPSQLPAYLIRHLDDSSSSLDISSTNTTMTPIKINYESPPGSILPADPDGPVSEVELLVRAQYSDLIKTYFAHITDLHIPDNTLIDSFIVELSSIIGPAALFQCKNEIPVILDSISTQLSLYLTSSAVENLGIRSDIFFFTAAYYGSATFHVGYGRSSLHKFTSILRAYVQRRGKDLSEDIRNKLRIPPFPPSTTIRSWWSFMYDSGRSSA